MGKEGCFEKKNKLETFQDAPLSIFQVLKLWINHLLSSNSEAKVGVDLPGQQKMCHWQWHNNQCEKHPMCQWTNKSFVHFFLKSEPNYFQILVFKINYSLCHCLTNQTLGDIVYIVYIRVVPFSIWTRNCWKFFFDLDSKSRSLTDETHPSWLSQIYRQKYTNTNTNTNTYSIGQWVVRSVG